MLFGSSILVAILAGLTYATPPAGRDATIRLTKDCTLEFTNLFEGCHGTKETGKCGDLIDGRCQSYNQEYNFPNEKICDPGEKDDYFTADLSFDGRTGIFKAQFGGQQRSIEVGLKPVKLRANGQGWEVDGVRKE